MSEFSKEQEIATSIWQLVDQLNSQMELANTNNLQVFLSSAERIRMPFEYKNLPTNCAFKVCAIKKTTEY